MGCYDLGHCAGDDGKLREEIEALVVLFFFPFLSLPFFPCPCSMLHAPCPKHRYLPPPDFPSSISLRGEGMKREQYINLEESFFFFSCLRADFFSLLRQKRSTLVSRSAASTGAMATSRVQRIFRGGHRPALSASCSNMIRGGGWCGWAVLGGMAPRWMRRMPGRFLSMSHQRRIVPLWAITS
jgi:hypothetical protein